MNIKLKNDIPVCQRARRLSCSEKFQILPGIHRKEKGIRTAADSVQSEWPLWHAAKSSSLRAQAQLKTRTETFELVEEKTKTLDIRKEKERERESYVGKELQKYFLDEDSLVASYEWIRDLFQDTPEGL
ncbi:hypothetical protein TNCV_641741 [Trichonephila clavipes]|nr:hypothetical protein TNCV_641741 [Trichonephila clavipes]